MATKEMTYPRKILPGQRLVRTLINVERIRAGTPAPFRRRHTSLAKIERADARAGMCKTSSAR